MKQKMQTRTKKLLITCAVFLIMGIAFITCGLLMGPSTFLYFEQGKLVTSNQQKIYAEKKELPAFSSIDLSLMTGQCTILEGDNFSVDYTSHYPGVVPIVAVENGTLKMSMARRPDATGVVTVPPIANKLEEENNIVITIPKDTKLVNIELTADWQGVNGLVPMSRSMSLRNIKAEKLTLHSDYSYVARTILTDCTIDKIEGRTLESISLNKVKAGTITLEVGRLAEDNYFNDVTADHLAITNIDYVAQKVINGNIGPVTSDNVAVQISRSTFGKLSFVGEGVSLKNVTSGGSEIYSGKSIRIESSALNGTTLLQAFGNITVDTTMQKKSFNYELKRAQGFAAPLAVELVDFDTPEYNEHGFITAQSQQAGWKKVLLTQEQYSYLSSSYATDTPESVYDENGNPLDETRTTYASGRNTLTGDYAKFRGYDGLLREYTDVGEMLYVDVQNKKTIAYYVDAQGQRIYMTKISDSQADITVDGIQNASQLLTVNNGASNQLNIHSFKGFVHVNFAP